MNKNNSENQFKSDLMALAIKHGFGDGKPKEVVGKASEELCDDIISLFKDKGKFGKSSFCQCSDSQDSFAEIKGGERTGRIICFDCEKPYGQSDNTNESDTVKDEVTLYWDFDRANDNSRVSSFWYWNKIGKKFKVKSCTCKGDLRDVEGVGAYDCTDFYMVSEGEYKGNLILKKHCKNK